jgi:hypothetical protein
VPPAKHIKSIQVHLKSIQATRKNIQINFIKTNLAILERMEILAKAA